jgi:hypothetical protein
MHASASLLKFEQSARVVVVEVTVTVVVEVPVTVVVEVPVTVVVVHWADSHVAPFQLQHS